jgi:hypothetical protein
VRLHLKNGLGRKPQYPNSAVRCRGNPRASARGGCQILQCMDYSFLPLSTPLISSFIESGIISAFLTE